MIGAVGQLLPVALAAALSSVPITIMLLILLSPRRRSAALPFMIGCVLGMLIVVVAATIASQALPPARAHRADRTLAVIEVTVGLALIVFGVRSWRRHLHATEEPRLPSWAAAVDHLGPIKAFGVGLIMAFRPKNLLLAAVIGLQLHVSSLKATASLALGICYVVLATSTVTIPILATLLAPARMEPRLGTASKMLATDGPIVSAVVLIVLGLVVVGAGLQSF
ncbi:GAP family protein [Microlunatus ginsengisoli]|uniref:GAP family protein n=1 Tax=Microlunatus ginsengisoli TaxID=363863 RepID=A0ABP6ZJ39_9ACTN